MERIRFTVSLLPEDTDIIAHLEKVKEHSTISLYVRNLIRQDISRGSKNSDDLVDKVIERLRANHKVSFNVNKNLKQEISKKQMELINSLF
ncbi:hypothetical protein [Alkalihalobacterium bogoriense]|uniref:hypothetical protein n=1 Tax=Alkalihalobacterium bogoriense TaxID=246272 RepID=UPI00047BC0C8|nr:hypothetical protein [Alkalihalobacterium bogoriense]